MWRSTFVSLSVLLLILLLSPLPSLRAADPELPIFNFPGIEVGSKGTLSWHHGKVIQVLDDDYLLVALDNSRTGRYIGFNVIVHIPGIGKKIADGKNIQAGDWEKYLGSPPNVVVSEVMRLHNSSGATASFYVLKSVEVKVKNGNNKNDNNNNNKKKKR